MPWNDPLDDEEWAKIQCDHRAALTRALTAQAWAVAIAICAPEYGVRDDDGDEQADYTEGWGNGWDDAVDDTIRHVADLPAPADLAAEILG